MATSAPAAAKARAVAAPMPREPPVTSAVLPARFLGKCVMLAPFFSDRYVTWSGLWTVAPGRQWDYVSIAMKIDEKPRGRPRSFDREAALERAMLLFWEHGYEATSLSQLTSAMGISPPSLYAAFGDKQALFLETVDRYIARGGADTQSLMGDTKTARESVAHFLEASAQRLTNPHFPRGCMVVLAAASCSEEAAPVQHQLAACRAAWEKTLRQRIEQGVAEGDVPRTASPAALASFYMAVVQGMSLHAKDGATRKRLQEIAETALQAWPARARRKK